MREARAECTDAGVIEEDGVVEDGMVEGDIEAHASGSNNDGALFNDGALIADLIPRSLRGLKPAEEWDAAACVL